MPTSPDSPWLILTQRQTIDCHGQLCDQIEREYIELFYKFGVHVQLMPNHSSVDVEAYLSLPNVYGVVLTGGNNIDPQSYGESIVSVNDSSLERDNLEKRLLHAAITFRLPVLGICRGMQMTNIYFGGSLVRDLSTQFSHHIARSHSIDLTDCSSLEGIGGKQWVVNSYHDQGVTEETLAKVLQPFALATGTSLIEGLYHPGLPIAAVQFHPERLMPQPDLGYLLVKSFLHGKGFWRD